MTAQTCIVILGRYGDVINILPCARDIALKEGGKCAVMVSDEFASVLEGCSYVEPVIVSSHFTDTQPAIEQARKMFDRVLVAKVSEKAVGVTTQCQSFNEESWRQIGYLNEWFRLPLVFDRRDLAREAKLIDQCSSKTGQPMVLVNFSGKSAPFGGSNRILEILSAYNIVDFGKIKAHRIYDLIGLMDAAGLLVTCDTSTLHLAAASGVPTVNLIGEKPTRWHGSLPRNNDVLSLRYGEAMESVERIRGAALKWKPRTWHVWSDYPMTGDTLRRHSLAKLTWRDTGWIAFPVTENRRVVNDPMRSVPFIKDLVNAAVQCAGPRDVIVLTNADTCVSTDAGKRVADAVNTHGCCYSFRRDFPHLDRKITTEEIRNGRLYEGSDLFAFTVEWWNKHQSTYPDMLIATETWDWAMRVLMKRNGGAEFDDLIAHESHKNVWESPEFRNSIPSQQHNRRLASQFLALNGVVAA